MRKVRYGDKVVVTFRSRPWEKKKWRRKETLYFRGYRILAGAGIADDLDSLVPVFTRPCKDGSMGRLHYGTREGESPTWWECIAAVEVVRKDA